MTKNMRKCLLLNSLLGSLLAPLGSLQACLGSTVGPFGSLGLPMGLQIAIF